MWSIGEVKSKGKGAFKANYWPCVATSLLLGVVTAGSSGSVASSGSNAVSASSEGQDVTSSLQSLDPEVLAMLIAIAGGAILFASVVSIILKIFLINPLKVGCYRFFRKNVETQDAPIGTIGECFGNYVHVFITLFLKDLFLALWTCLFIIPGIIKSYSYRMVPYIIKDYPELSAKEVIDKSREMMNGNKWKAFVFDLSFIGWGLLSLITCGILGIFWVNPYIYNSKAALYLELKEQ